MKIAVVDLISLDGGGFHITNSLYNYVASGKSKQHEWLFIVSFQDFSSNEYVMVKQLHKGNKGYIERALTELKDVNRELIDFDADIVIAMSNMRVLGCKRKQLVYMQQSIPFQKEKKFSFLKPMERKYAFRQYIQGFMIKRSLKKAEAVIVQTEWIKTAVKSQTKHSKVVNIGYPGKEKVGSSPVRAEKVCTDFFYPSGPEVYKNLTVIVEAADILRWEGYQFKIYLTMTEEELKSLIGKDVNRDSFVCMGRIESQRVIELYAQTTLVFASYIETVGLPLVEARNVGTWIIASDCAFSHEVLGDYPNKEFFSPHNVDELVSKMRKVLEQKVALSQVLSTQNNIQNCWDKLMTYIEQIR